MNPLEKLPVFLTQLDRRKIHFRLSRVRDEAILVEIAVPGERWEVEFFGDGHAEVEVFRSSQGIIGGEELFEALFRENSD
jgi:hypothetical protein